MIVIIGDSNNGVSTLLTPQAHKVLEAVHGLMVLKVIDWPDLWSVFSYGRCPKGIATFADDLEGVTGTRQDRADILDEVRAGGGQVITPNYGNYVPMSNQFPEETLAGSVSLSYFRTQLGLPEYAPGKEPVNVSRSGSLMGMGVGIDG